MRARAEMLVVAGPLLGCADIVAPNGGVTIVVAPDTVEANQTVSPPSVLVRFAIRNTNTFTIGVSPCAPDVEREVATDVGEITRVADDCLLEPMSAGTHRFLVAFVPVIGPGRYRLRSSYAVAGKNGISATEKPTLNQTSNAFVVLP